MGNQCRKIATDVIPDRDVMIEIVDTIVAFEEMLKRGETLTDEQKREQKKLAPVARALKTANGSDLLSKK